MEDEKIEDLPNMRLREAIKEFIEELPLVVSDDFDENDVFEILENLVKNSLSELIEWSKFDTVFPKGGHH